jgi:hypothetical protein
MNILDRLCYALIGMVFGAMIGVVCWWLYGLAHSLNYAGPGMDPILRHWLTYASAAYAAFGFFFRDSVGNIVGDTLGAIFQFKANSVPEGKASPIVSLLFIVIIVAAIWFTAPLQNEL